MKNKKIITFVLAIALLYSCNTKKGYVKFDKRSDELIATEKVKSFFKLNPHPSIVLRVPQSTSGVTQSDQNSYIYNAIEKELVIAGFNLKDRGLFNQVLNSQASLDYSKIKDLTGTDLILELVKVDMKVPYNTNIAYMKNDKQVILKRINYMRYGAIIEFKLILVKNNEYGGSFSFTYTPCSDKNDNCYCKVPYKYAGKFYPDVKANFCRIDKRKNAIISAYDFIPQDDFEKFVREGVKKVISSLNQ